MNAFGLASASMIWKVVTGSKDDHRELCMRQLVGLVRDAGIRPFRYLFEDPAKYFAVLEAVGSVDMSLGIKTGVQFR